MPLELREALLLGVPHIDEEHARLIDTVNAIRADIACGDAESWRARMADLAQQARVHFASEEAFLERLGYPELDSHRSYHTHLLERVDDLRATCLDTEDPAALAPCIEEMVEFVVDDIVTGDTAFKSFVEDALDLRPLNGSR